jgi:hypothetical protein
MKKNVIISELPVIGMGGTLLYHSDRSPITVIQVLHNGKRLVLQEDKATRTDSNGMSESQSYDYEIDPNGAIHYATLRKDGTYRLVGGKTRVSLGNRSKYYDYSF